jgi:hypothetical protein
MVNGLTIQDSDFTLIINSTVVFIRLQSLEWDGTALVRIT